MSDKPMTFDVDKWLADPSTCNYLPQDVFENDDVIELVAAAVDAAVAQTRTELTALMTCGHPTACWTIPKCECCCSTDVSKQLSKGTGHLDNNGFWEFPCTHEYCNFCAALADKDTKLAELMVYLRDLMSVSTRCVMTTL